MGKWKGEGTNFSCSLALLIPPLQDVEIAAGKERERERERDRERDPSRQQFGERGSGR